MYPVDKLDTVTELLEVPKPDIGAPLPIVVSDEHQLLLAYLISEPDLNWDGSYVNVVSPDTGGLPVAVIEFHSAYAHMFGPPNDEAFSGHPLASRGLMPYSVFEIGRSSWIRQLERMNSVHPQHNADWFIEGMRHFAFVFHDSTFECIANGFTVDVQRGSMHGAMAHMLALLKQDSL